MIVPRFWAEGRLQHHERRENSRHRQVTVRRFGWSDISQDDAQQMADARAAEALKEILSGKKLARTEQRVPYNGADGLPIREEIIEERNGAVLTRNRYGALCLNTPDIVFIDIDREQWRYRRTAAGTATVVVVVLLSVGAIFVAGGFAMDSTAALAISVLFIVFIATLLGIALRAIGRRLLNLICGGVDRRILGSIHEFFAKNLDLAAALYETPGGYRLLFTHRRADANSTEVQRWFDAFGADPEYASMCQKQHCFRARVSAKPWRIGLTSLQRIVSAVWPISPERLAKREEWVREYDERSRNYAACRFLESLGSASTPPEIERFRQWHDDLSRAGTGLPIA